MREESKQLIERLKNVAADLHRSASKLDEFVRSMEKTAEEYSDDPELVQHVFSRYYAYRYDYLRSNDLIGLEPIEVDIWKRLIDSAKETEES